MISKDSTEFIRGNHPANMLLVEYAKITSFYFFQEKVGPVIEKYLSPNLSASFQEDSPELTEENKLFISFIQEILDSVLSSVEEIPV